MLSSKKVPAREGYNCQACKEKDTEEMVACDRCDSWWHFACVGVSSSISERSFVCRNCQPVPEDTATAMPEDTVRQAEVTEHSQGPAAISVVGSTTSISRTRTKLTLERLEAERELKKKQLDLERRARDVELELRQLEVDEQYHKERFRCLEADIIEDDARSSRSSVSTSIQKVQRWRCAPMTASSTLAQVATGLKDTGIPARNIEGRPVINKLTRQSEVGENQVASKTGAIPKRTRELVEAKSSSGQVNQGTGNSFKAQLMSFDISPIRGANNTIVSPNELVNTNPNSQPNKPVHSFAVHPGTEGEVNATTREQPNVVIRKNHSDEVGFNCRGERVRNNGRYEKRPDGAEDPSGFLLSGRWNGNDDYTTGFIRADLDSNEFDREEPQEQRRRLGPTTQQLAARQVLKDLPQFSGCPDDWPVFISTYRTTTKACGFSEEENFMRLQRSLTGPAKEAVRGELLVPAGVPSALDTLETIYGRPELLVHTLLHKVRSVPAPKPDKFDTLVTFGIVVKNLCAVLIATDQEAHLNNPSLLVELVNKLPYHLQLDWAIYRQRSSRKDIQGFASYMSIISSAASDLTLRIDSFETKRGGRNQNNFCGAHVTEETSYEVGLDTISDEGSTPTGVQKKPSLKYQPKCLICQKPDHRLKECPDFQKLAVDDRWQKVRELRVCCICLGCHGRRPCKSTKLCEIEGCRWKHHILLHARSEARAEAMVETEAVTNHHHGGRSTFYRILPVTLFGRGEPVEVYAFVDNGSSATLVEEEVIRKLDIEGETVPLCLQWTAGVTRNEEKSRRVSIQVKGSTKQQKFTIKARTVGTLDLPRQTIRIAELAAQFPHLQGLPISSYEDIRPTILLGNDNAFVTVTQKIREGAPGTPIAAKCRLGWSIYGASGRGKLQSSLHVHECACDRELHDLVKKHFHDESRSWQKVDSPLSVEDERAYEILKATTKRVGERFETGLLWRFDDFEFPDSRLMAERRLLCLERRMKRSLEIGDSVRRQMVEYVNKGYIHLATEEELTNIDPRRIWYLPLGVALNPKKPSKIRIFCDAAAKVDGISLNTMLIPGPDMLTSLPRILFGFREKAIAICADLREMFHQVKIRKADCNSQRILWRDDPSEPVKTYIMSVATFGSACSPSSVQFVKNLNAREHAREYPQAAEAIIEHHYVDDWMDSADTTEEAAKLASAVEYVHKKGGFQIHNWLSNSDAFLKLVGSELAAEVKVLPSDKDSTQRVLGMLWRPTEDVFIFGSVPVREGVHPTKREILRTVMSLFDPLGFLSFFIIHGKIIIQDLWRAKTDWDTRIPDQIHRKWLEWTEHFRDLQNVRIDRHYFGKMKSKQTGNIQLHVFCDASELAYACVAYFRVRIGGEIRCALVAGKSKVAPLKTLSIPRLELQAAVEGVRIQKSIMETHRLTIESTTFWSDSRTVLSWIRSDSRRYRQYVACRVGEILSNTNAEDWRWVPTRENVADDATKWGRGLDFTPSSRWFQGPSFLYHEEGDWPAESVTEVETEEELEECLVHEEVQKQQMVDWISFSKWKRLWRTVAFVRRFCFNFRCKMKGLPDGLHGPLTKEELVKAEQTVLRWVQKEYYPVEYRWLKEATQGKIRKYDGNSPLAKLSPCLDQNDIIRLESRIVAASYASFDARYPIVLPKQHRVTQLIVEDYHDKFLHANKEMVVNELRQRFHIGNLRNLVKQVSKECLWCKVRKPQIAMPRMAPLPKARLQAFVRPFTFVGLDYFGPMNVRIGRSVSKRWVALFTCLTIRAVCLEVVHSLSTESCKMAIRRFISRHGSPQEIYSDNGTNFVGSANELQKAIDHGDISESFTNSSTKWIFNPPAAPHMGGAWERLVRSVKTAMAAMLTTKTPDEETFITIVREAEGVVNTRPLTFIPIDDETSEALTPNHFMKLSSSGVSQPSRPLGDERLAHRDNWNHLNVAVDNFWKRWVKEYLPSIARRTKWFRDTPPIEVGDLVMIVNETERNGWIRGRVIRVADSKDGRRRRASVQTDRGILQRPVSKIARLDIDPGKERSSKSFSDLSYGRGDVADSMNGL
ncbi:uncharacterized protein LOC129742057 [Uranotaenia lowii]|uniref:uncharacterized protein LOC129742057 n=1 Tax=Uranotaenia lowii TaxID=190385 RepID=UPI00247A24CF|nr:uncharacterized protein LOC129742057 [Uranotaenia lowii]